MGMFTDSFRHILEDDSAFCSLLFEFVVDRGRVILSSYASEVFFFCFRDLEAFENSFDVCRDLISFCHYPFLSFCRSFSFFGGGKRRFCIVDDIVELEAGKVGSECWIFAFTKNFQTMQPMLKHSIWLVEVSGNLSNSIGGESFEKDFIGNGVCLF
jgi:hypothetical protein